MASLSPPQKPVSQIELAPEWTIVRRDVLMGEATRTLHRPIVLPRKGSPKIGSALISASGPRAAAENAMIALSPAEQSEEIRAGFEIARAKGQAAGHAAGLETGYAQGRKEGLQSAHTEAQDRDNAARQAQSAQLSRIKTMLSTFSSQFDQRLEAAEDDMVALCMTVIGRMLGETAVGIEGTKAIVRQALNELGAQPVATIRVHPDDLIGLQADSVWQRELQATGRISWQADSAITLGGCVVGTPQGDLDARLETQLAQLTAYLTDARFRSLL